MKHWLSISHSDKVKEHQDQEHKWAGWWEMKEERGKGESY